MNRFMLSFSQGKPVALALGRHGEVLHTIHVTENRDLPDLDVDDPVDLIEPVDIEMVGKTLRLGVIQKKVLVNAIKKKSSEGLSEELKRAYGILVDKAHTKLKTEINFDKDSEVSMVIPLIGFDQPGFDRSIVFFGPSGSGKSFLAKKVMMNDPQKRKIVLFSKVRDDPSLKELTATKNIAQEPRLVQVPVFTDQDLVNLPPDSDLSGKICFFDDIDSFPFAQAEYLRAYRDALLEAGRHKNVTVMSTSHITLNYNKTRTVLNEAEIAVLFPPANRRSADAFLKDRMGLVKAERDFLIAKANSTGRFLAVRMSNPNLVIHSKGIMLL